MQPALRHCGVTRLARVTGLDHVGVAVSVAVRPLSRTLSVSQGKGMSAELADISAAMEAVELWHSENAPRGELRGSFLELSARGYPVVDPLTLRPEGVFPRAADLRRRPCEWLPALDLGCGSERFVPRYQCALAADEAHVEHLASMANSTGLSGGNSLDEATSHALCESIERDAMGQFEALTAPERDARAVVPSTLPTAARHLVERLAQAELGVRLWDQTSAVGVPVFGCTIESSSELRGLGRFAGYGAHLDPRIAVSRAITEAIQSRLTIISGARDDKPPLSYAAMQLAVSATVPAPEPTRAFAEVGSPRTTGSFAGDVEALVARLGAAGFSSVLRVDLTRAELGIPVVFVLLPNMVMVLD